MIVPKNIEVRALDGGFTVMVDGQEFPWAIERMAPEIDLLTPPGCTNPLYSFHIGILVDSVTGATPEEVEQVFAEQHEFAQRMQADARDRSADLRDLAAIA